MSSWHRLSGQPGPGDTAVLATGQSLDTDVTYSVEFGTIQERRKVGREYVVSTIPVEDVLWLLRQHGYAGESSPLVKYYAGDGVDGAGRNISRVLSWSDDEFESCHDHIQWLFPTRTPSSFNRGAPTLTDTDIVDIRSIWFASRNFDAALKRAYSFYEIGKSGTPWWARPGQHNLLRITRIIESVREIRSWNAASAVLRKFKLAVDGIPGLENSIGYWERAIQ